MGRVLAPVVSILDGITSCVTRRLGVREMDRDRISPEELMILVERGGEQGIIEAEEEQMIGAVLGLGERKVHEVMVPRIAMVALPATATLDQMVDTIVEGGHSRIPVYEDSVDNVVGILYAKDLLPYLKGEDQPPPVGRLVRAPLFVPESMSVDDLLHSLQRRRVHIAIVLDEYGGTAGMVTIEDLLEEIVGEIQDEYDTEEPMIVPLGDDQARVDGRAAIEDLLEHFHLPADAVEDQEEYDTVGGLIYHRIGGIPKVGDEVRVGESLLHDRGNDRRSSRGQGPGAAARGRRGGVQAQTTTERRAARHARPRRAGAHHGEPLRQRTRRADSPARWPGCSPRVSATASERRSAGPSSMPGCSPL